jgi:hypothetical protein
MLQLPVELSSGAYAPGVMSGASALYPPPTAIRIICASGAVVYSALTWMPWDVPAPAWVMENWPGRATMLALRCKGIREGKPVDETRKYVSSLRTGAEALQQPIHLLQCQRGPCSPMPQGPPLRSAVDRSGLEKSTTRT